MTDDSKKIKHLEECVDELNECVRCLKYLAEQQIEFMEYVKTSMKTISIALMFITAMEIARMFQ